MDLERLRDILKLVSESDVSEVEIEEEDLRIFVRKAAPAPAPAPMVQSWEIPAAQPAPQPAPQPAAAPQAPAAAPAEPAGTEVRAPIVGTFYEAASPDSKPYVQVGDSVKAGDVLCIIEAMKLMNEIESEVSGTVRKILVKNATPVEYDQPLFIIEPA
ncbi:MAG: acetyl-CoA carboxylase biotin carboxyl carrier protein [Rhodothermales bacterium]